MKKTIILLSIIISGFLYSQEVKEVTILHWNDFHAKNTAYPVSKKDSLGKEYYILVGGSSSMLGYINKFRDEKSLVLNAGDDFQGTPISNFTRGKSQILLLNEFKLDAFVIGNHEFDYSQYSLDSALKQANFDVLSGNTYYKITNSSFGKPNTIKYVNGVKIGIIGITLPDLYSVALPKNIDQIVMLNTDSVISANIDYLKKEKCNLIVLLSHCGFDYDKEIAGKFFKDIDIIVGGHSHTPLFKPGNVNGVIIVQAGAYARYLGKLNLNVDILKDTVISYSGKLFETVFDSSVYDVALQSKVDNMLSEYMPELSKVIGKLEVDWKTSYYEECFLGQFEADAFRKKTGADIAFINAGGLRKSMFKGDITVGDIWEINPFGNEIMEFEVDGKTFKQMLNNNIKIRKDGEAKGSNVEILNISGCEYTYDSRNTNSDAYLMKVIIGGKEIENNKNYKIVTNSFVFSQFKKFFGEISTTFNGKNTGYIDRDIVIDYVKETGTITDKFSKRIVDLGK